MSSEETPPDGYSYNIEIYTGSQWGAGSDANVLITIYGENGDTGLRQLDNAGNNFERDSKDSFKIVHYGEYMGRITKISIGHDNSGIGPAWFLNKVLVEDAKTCEEFEFPCEEWFGDDHGGLLSRELEYKNVIVKDPEKNKGHLYTIHIYTGNEWGAGTDANVHVTIYGTKGDSEEYRFENKGSSTFEAGVKDSFKVETQESLGTIYKVRVGHDNTGWGPGWFLDKIEVEDDKNGEVVEFICGKWLATDGDDGLIKRDLMREGFVEDKDSSLEEATYKVHIYTGEAFGAGTDANILFTLYGTAGESEQQTFENEGSTTFENGMIDTVEFKCPYLGTLHKVRIGHDNTGWGPAWFLDKVTVEDTKTGETAVFSCNRWLATNADDGMIERELKREGYYGDVIIEGLPDDLKGEPLGIETGNLKGECITGSSSADDTPACNARLNHASGWCPKEADGCWLQVDLIRLHCVTSVATQGNPSGNNDYVKKFKIQYSHDGENWTNHEENGNQLFDANEDHSTIKTIDLQKYIIARYIRICPVEWYCWPCLRVEVYGVPIKEGETEVKTVSYVTEQVVVTSNTDETEGEPDEKDRAEDAINLILSQTGDKRKDIKDQKQQIEDEMKELEKERKERGRTREENLKRLEEEARMKEEEEERKREEESEKKRSLEEERKKKVELEVEKIEKEHQARLDELDKVMKDAEERKRKEFEETKNPEGEEIRRPEDERKKIDKEERLENEFSTTVVKKTTTDVSDRTQDEDKVLTVNTTTRVVVESNIDDESRGDDKVDDEMITTNIEDGDEDKIVTITKTVVVETSLDDELREKDEEEEDVVPKIDDGNENVETITTTTTEVIVESSLDDEPRDEDVEKPEEGYVFVERENEEEKKTRLEYEAARERFEKMRKTQEDEDRRRREAEELNVILLERPNISGEVDDNKDGEEDEEKKKKEEAKKIKERQDKEREEEERKKKQKEEKKAKRKAEKEKKKMVKGKITSSDSLSSLSSSSTSSSSEDEETTVVSNIDKTPFRAPIASVDDEGEDEVTKLVTYRTTTTTTTRIVSWPGTYFFKPIEPGAKQPHYPEDVGLLFGFDDVKPHQGGARCDHLKPEDAAVRSAQESSFSSKFLDDSGPKPVWYGGLDTESTLPISVIRDEDIDRLVEWEKAGDLGWKRTKTTLDYEIWKRKAHEGGPPIIKAVVTLDGIPYNSAIRLLSDWKSRHEWDKTFDKIEFLESSGPTTVIHCPVKKREYALAILDRQDNEEPFYASAWRNTTHPKIDLSKKKRLKLFYLVSGLVIRPIDDGSQSSKVTIICQVKGSVPSKVKSTFLAAKPAKWIVQLKKYHTKTSQPRVKEE